MRDQLLKSRCRTVNVEVVYGSPTAVILELARANRFSSIVMGTQGRGFIEEIFLGSVANNVARHAPLPVLFVPAVR
jgi:nucleotide-binding universal stress UspA family protein